MGGSSTNATIGSASYIDSSSSSYLSPVEAPSRRPELSPALPPLPAPDGSQQTSNPLSKFVQFPNVVWNLNPDVKLKLRKRFYPLSLTCLTLGADFDLKTRDVAFKWSWKDRIIGGQLEFFANQVSLTKRFDIDKRTKLDVRAAFDIQTRRTLFSLNVKPFGAIVAHDRPPSGLSIRQKIPVDRHLAIEFQGRLNLPEARFSNETATAVSLGEGNFTFDLDELNLRFMLQ